MYVTRIKLQIEVARKKLFRNDTQHFQSAFQQSSLHTQLIICIIDHVWLMFKKIYPAVLEIFEKKTLKHENYPKIIPGIMRWKNLLIQMPVRKSTKLSLHQNISSRHFGVFSNQNDQIYVHLLFHSLLQCKR